MINAAAPFCSTYLLFIYAGICIFALRSSILTILCILVCTGFFSAVCSL